MRKKSFVTLSGFILFAKYSRNLSLFYLLCKMLLVGWYRLLECKKKSIRKCTHVLYCTVRNVWADFVVRD